MLLRLLASLAAAVATAAIATQVVAQDARTACTTPNVSSKSGFICGIDLGETYAFLGIPYAESTAGARRWTAPVPKAAWTDVLRATAYGAECPQNSATPRALPQSEDCLSLNVWRPKTTAGSNLPVLVFIHGGAYVVGSSGGGERLPSNPDQSLYDGAYLAQSQGIVVVTLNYRLGALGFLAGSAGLTGNYGIMDQQLALAWVRDNIAAFGGDPTRVTISGESAGAGSVGVHLLSAPASKPLFRAAIMQSNPIGLPFRNLSEAKRTGDYFLFAVGCFYAARPLECLRAKPVEALLKAQASPLINLPVLEFGLYSLITWSPVVDGRVVTQAPLASAAAGGLDKPTIIGTNTEEGILFTGTNAISRNLYRAALGKLYSLGQIDAIEALYPPINGDNRATLGRIATDAFFYCPNRFVSLQAKAPVYSYLFTFATDAVNVFPNNPLCKGKACHGQELPFAFNTLGISSDITDADRAVGKAMTDDWGAFVRDLKPASSAWQNFTPQSQALLEINATPRTVPADTARCAYWDARGYGRDGLQP
jgi:carboxylesterase type B